MGCTDQHVKNFYRVCGRTKIRINNIYANTDLRETTDYVVDDGVVRKIRDGGHFRNCIHTVNRLNCRNGEFVRGNMQEASGDSAEEKCRVLGQENGSRYYHRDFIESSDKYDDDFNF